MLPLTFEVNTCPLYKNDQLDILFFLITYSTAVQRPCMRHNEGAVLSYALGWPSSLVIFSTLSHLSLNIKVLWSQLSKK